MPMKAWDLSGKIFEVYISKMFIIFFLGTRKDSMWPLQERKSI